MPRFAKLGLLFIHIPKNAGRSIEQTLLQGVGTPDSGRRSLVNRMATGLQRLSQSDFARTHLIGTIDHSFAAQHLTYGEMEMLGILGSERTSFAVARNPFDRAVSSVFHFRAGGSSGISNPADFEYMLDAWLDRPLADHNDRAHRRPQADYVIDMQGTKAVDHILRFERLESDYRNFLNDHEVSGIELSWRGKSARQEGYRDYFSPHARQAVEREFARDLDMFEYSF